jgi:hypothetical protein
MRLANPTPGSTRLARVLPGLLLVGALGAGCEPTVRVEAPREPITINLNIKLEADVRVRVEEKAKEDIATNPEVF